MTLTPTSTFPSTPLQMTLEEYLNSPLLGTLELTPVQILRGR